VPETVPYTVKLLSDAYSEDDMSAHVTETLSVEPFSNTAVTMEGNVGFVPTMVLTETALILSIVEVVVVALLTVTLQVAVLSPIFAVMVQLPTLTAVTLPLLFTVATLFLEDDHVTLALGQHRTTAKKSAIYLWDSTKQRVVGENLLRGQT